MDWPVGFEPPAAPVKASEEKVDVSAEEEEEALTVSVKLWTALGEMLFDAVMVIGNEPLAVGVPLRMPALNVTPGGSAPDSVIVVVGVPVAVTVNEPAEPSLNVALLALVMVGATWFGVEGVELVDPPPPHPNRKTNPVRMPAITALLAFALMISPFTSSS